MILTALSSFMTAVQQNTRQTLRLEDLQGINSTGAPDDQSHSGTETTLNPVFRDKLEGSRFSGHRICHEYDDAWEHNGVEEIVLISRWSVRL